MGFVVIKVKPQKKDFAACTECVLEDCDLLFICEKDLDCSRKTSKHFPLARLILKEARRERCPFHIYK